MKKKIDWQKMDLAHDKRHHATPGWKEAEGLSWTWPLFTIWLGIIGIMALIIIYFTVRDMMGGRI